ncbi:motility associated factor glycosyltransferase family protein [Aquibacillus kalidii]|uniref:motility associated factor glycosyltransferase family protein n=1 Tax=Aquibacillus kalidii TaxID=2762597 RepID=UPI00164737A0|nr:6-hydroxymethylpterin diphosphokinase MptE-like protein [Aquibacillus kalidii]
MVNILNLNSPIDDMQDDLLIVKAKTGEPIGIQGGYYLNSKYDPKKEANQLANRYYKKNFTHVLFGLSFGYLANELLKKMGKTDFLLIVEPNKYLFEIVKKSGVLAGLLDHSQVLFLIGYEFNTVEEEVKKFVHSKSRNIGQVEFILSPNYDKLHPHLYKHLKEEIIKNVRLSIVNVATLVKFDKSWHDNFLHNLYSLWKAVPFKNFENKFDCPVIIAASGPSLNKQLDKLRNLRDKNKAIIIAAGSTINPLLNAGIKPHLIVSIDGGEANWNHFKDINFDDIPLFYGFNVHKNIVNKHNGLKVIFNSYEQGLTNWINSLAGTELGFLHSGASVANFCFQIAQKITTGPIALVGQDLAYTDNLTHAVGNKNTKLIPNNEIQNNKKYVEVQGYYGKSVLSDYSFLSMKKAFEDMVLYFRNKGVDRTIFNCTEGGAFIEGIINLSFGEFISKYCETNYKSELIEAFQIRNEEKISREKVTQGLKEEKVNLKSLERTVKKAINTIKGISETTEYIDNIILKKLDRLDDEITRYSKNNIIHSQIMSISFKIDHIYQENENETKLERKNRVIKKSKALYKSILEAVEYSLEIIEDIENER